MPTKRKSTRRKAAEAPAPEKKPQKLTKLTLVHVQYHPEAKLLRANVQQDVEFAGASQRQGRDIDIAIDDLDANIREALEDAFEWIAEEVGATPFKEED